MARFESDEEVRRLASALARLRQSARLSQAEAGQRAGMTSQGWSAYESGRRPGLFRPDVQRRLTAALGADAETLALEAAGAPSTSDPTVNASGVASRSREWASAPTQISGRLTLADDALAPWAASGVTLEHISGEPRPGQGAVVQLQDGDRVVGLVVKSDPSSLTLTLHVAKGLTRQYARTDIVGVSVVVARHEP